MGLKVRAARGAWGGAWLVCSRPLPPVIVLPAGRMKPPFVGATQPRSHKGRKNTLSSSPAVPRGAGRQARQAE